MATLVDPPLVRLTHQIIYPRRYCRDAGTSIIGVPQRVGNGIKIWEAELGIAPDFEPDRIKDFEAFVAELTCDTIVRIPIYDFYGYGAGYLIGEQEPWADGTFWSDGTGWISDPNSGHGLMVLTGAAVGGSSIQLDLKGHPNLSRGDYFSVDGFVYIVTSSGAAGNIQFAPRARRAILAGSAIETAPVTFYGKPTGEDFGRRGRGPNSIAPAMSLSFVEAFDR